MDETGGKRRVNRYVQAKLDSVTRTPQGGMRVDAALTRSGVFVYTDEGGKEVREWRPPEEVFSQISMDSLQSAPCTDLHPPVLIDPTNYRQYNTGHVAEGSVKRDGDKIAAVLIVQDAAAIQAVESGARKEVSCGYTCETEEIQGITPEGERYDRIQRGVKYNHVAIVPDGRAGSDVSLRLDSAGNQLPGNAPRVEARTMNKTIRIDGIDYPLSTDAEISAAVQAHKRHMDAMEAKVVSLTAERDGFKGRMDAAEVKATKAAADLTEVTAPARMDAAVKARTDLMVKATAILGRSVKLDGMGEREILTAVVVKSDPKVKVDANTSMDYLRGRFEGITSRVDTSDPDGLRRLHLAAVPRLDAEDPEAPEGEDEVEDAAEGGDKPNAGHPDGCMCDDCKMDRETAVDQAAAVDAAMSGSRSDGREVSSSASARARMDRTNREAWQRPLAFTKTRGRA
jgi:hypothetical protein